MVLTNLNTSCETISYAIFGEEKYVGHVPFIYSLDCGQISPNNDHTNYMYVHNSVLLSTNK